MLLPQSKSAAVKKYYCHKHSARQTFEYGEVLDSVYCTLDNHLSWCFSVEQVIWTTYLMTAGYSVVITIFEKKNHIYSVWFSTE